MNNAQTTPTRTAGTAAAAARSRTTRFVSGATGGALLLSAALAGTSAGTAAAASTASVKAHADSFVSAATPTTNRGTASYLQLDNSPVLRGYLRFTVPVPTGERLTRALLTVTPNTTSSAITVRPAGNSWTETGLTYTNAPAPTSTTTVRSGPLTAGVPLTLDVTATLPAAGGTATLVLDNTTATSFSLRSRETTSAPTLNITTTATTSTAPAPTTSTAPAPAPAPSTAPKLTWAPPALTNPKTYRVSGDGPGTITAAAGQDSIVVFDGPVHRRIRMSGGRHWVIRGGEVRNDKTWPSLDDQSGLQFENATGTAFVEGVHIHGHLGKDGIRVGNGGSNLTLIVQNTRITGRMAGPTGYHADVIQPYGGVKALKVDRLTGHGDYQGQMWKQEPGTTFGPTDFRRVNYRAATPQVQYMINFVMSTPTQPVTLTEVYNQPDPTFAGGDWCRTSVPSTGRTCSTDSTGRKTVSWTGTPTTINGHIKQGAPSTGDYVPTTLAGLTYTTPGYL